MVVVLHVTVFGAHAENYYAIQTFQFVEHFMTFGVDIFFVISGVIMSGILRSEQSGQGPVVASLGFLFRRAVRIYPVYWLSLIAVSLLLKFGKMKWPHAFWPKQHTLQTLTLTSTHPMLPVTWTLVYELQFYLVIGFALLFRRHAVIVVAIWAVVHVILTAAAWPYWSVGGYFAAPISLEFILGLIVGYAVQRFRIPLILAPLAALIAFGLQYYLGVQMVASNVGWVHFFVNGPTAAVIVWAAMSWEIKGGVAPRPLTLAGDISYSIYMWHWPALLLLLLVFGGSTSRGLVYAAFLATAMIVIATLGYLSYRFVELPTNAWASRVTRSRRQPAVVPPAVAS
jgi:peptidoglycan/LPS O-acetylase OafA/YrhL